MKIRFHQLAKELHLKAEEIASDLEILSLSRVGPLGFLTDEQARHIREHYSSLRETTIQRAQEITGQELALPNLSAGQKKRLVEYYNTLKDHQKRWIAQHYHTTTKRGPNKANTPKSHVSQAAERVQQAAADQPSGRFTDARRAAKHVGIPALETDPFLYPLVDDVTKARERLDKADTQFHRRTYVRTFCSTAEAIISTLSHWILERLDDVSLAEHEKAFTKSLLQSTRRSIIHKHSTRMVLATYAVMRNCNRDFFTSNGWSAFKRTRLIRNNLTHPDRHKGVKVDDAALSTVQDAHEWLFQVIADLEQSPETTGDGSPFTRTTN